MQDMNTNEQSLHCLRARIQGMNCASCEVVLERKIKKIPGIHRVSVSYSKGEAVIQANRPVSRDELQHAFGDEHYTVTVVNRETVAPSRGEIAITKNHIRAGVMLVVVLAVYALLKRFNLAPSIAPEETLSYGAIFVVGLIAAMSTCIAVTGGLLVALAAKYNEAHPNLTPRQKMRPLIYFNVGRVVSYAMLGGAMGMLGGVVGYSPKISGALTIIVAVAMVALGFQLLDIFSWTRRMQFKMPKFIAHRIHDIGESKNPAAPFFAGALTFFLPCGFTQALQLYALSQGSFVVGALTMGIFALGTLPTLMSLSALSSFAKGTFKQYFLKFAGAMALVIGITSISPGFALLGFSRASIANAFRSENSGGLSGVVAEGKQIVNMRVDGLDYYPSNFTIKKGVPVEWRIDGSAANGCAGVITVPKLGITKRLTTNTVISFTPQKEGFIPFSCTMGMTTPGAGFTVIE